ncbi:MAG: GNAT family N-acetyltransferase [Campylobacterales bacterium]|jgi:GNAT superfamily N-acetyltransferase
MRFVPIEHTEQAALCAALAETIWREYYTPIIGEAQVDYMLRTFQSAEAIDAQIQEGYRYVLAFEDDRPVGYYATVPQGDALKISKLYLLKAFRGEGRGRTMLEACDREARDRGYSRMLLTVNRHNPTVGFYEKTGFRNIGALLQEIGGGFAMDDYVMARDVSSSTSGRGSPR